MLGIDRYRKLSATQGNFWVQSALKVFKGRTQNARQVEELLLLFVV